VIELPAALAPWAAELSLLSADLALALAPWVGRLSVALGPMSAVRTAGAGEPDGYGGLTRRGSYERLVTAEWALAELYPDEFVRRASAGEHLFLDLARRAPRGSRRAIAILSAGPSQLGAPRLAHLAALIVLARRAASAGATFQWGLLEDPTLTLTTGLDAAGIRRLLDGRTARAAGEPVRGAWLATLGASADDVDASWIGGPELAAVPGTRLIVRDVIEPGVRALDVEVLRRAGGARVRLALPPGAVCARLLRDPLARGAGTRVAVARSSGHLVRFVARGVKVALVAPGRPVVTWPVPNSPRAPLGAPRTWTGSPAGALVAVGMRGKALLRVWIDPADPGAFRIREGNGDVTVDAAIPADTADAALAAGDSPPIGVAAVVKIRLHQLDLVVEGPDARMYLVAGYPPASSTKPLVATPFVAGAPDARVLRALLRDRDALWAQKGSAGVEIIRLTEAGTAVVARVESDEATPAVHIGRHARQSTAWGPFAIHRGDGRWQIVRSGEPAVDVTVDEPVVGLVTAPGGAPALLVRVDDRRLAIGHGAGRIELPAASAPIVDVVTSTYEPRIAWCTADEIVVYSLAHRAVLVRLVPDAGGQVLGAPA
jgi:hypothetical protein